MNAVCTDMQIVEICRAVIYLYSLKSILQNLSGAGGSVSQTIHDSRASMFVSAFFASASCCLRLSKVILVPEFSFSDAGADISAMADAADVATFSRSKTALTVVKLPQLSAEERTTRRAKTEANRRAHRCFSHDCEVASRARAARALGVDGDCA